MPISRVEEASIELARADILFKICRDIERWFDVSDKYDRDMVLDDVRDDLIRAGIAHIDKAVKLLMITKQ